MTDTDTFGRRETDRPDAAPRPLEVVVDGEDGRERYTFVPRDADGEELLTRWITVDREGLVDLDAWR